MAGSAAAQDLFFNVYGNWYKGGLPVLYDTTKLPWTRLLEDNWQVIKEEIESHYANHAESFQPNYTPYAYLEQGWKTVNLYACFLRYKSQCAKFPKLDSIVRQIPGMSMVQIGGLEPHTRLKAHFGESNAMIRCHLGLTIPAPLPEVGFRVGKHVIGWEEGKTWAFCNAYPHYAWNNTDKPRIALIVDVLREELMPRKYMIAGRTLAAMVTKSVATKFPALKQVPRPVTTVTHRSLSGMFNLMLRLQDRFDFNVAEFVRER